jgi:hypothetical protein
MVEDTTSLSVTPENIPEEFKARPQWVVWRWVIRRNRNGEPCKTKVPFQPRWLSKKAMANDPSTWSTFELALSIFEANPQMDGIGYMFAADDSYCGIDFDSCIDSDGEIEPFAWQWLKKIGGYQERSASGTGIHAVVKARKPKDCRSRKSNPGGKVKEVEIYDRERFFVFTGHILEGFDSVDENQQTIDEFLNTLFPAKPRKPPRARVAASIDDTELLDRARNAATGHMFTALYDKGDVSGYGDDHSRADFALINMLIFWCAGDEERIMRLFEQSALYREREKHRGYVSLSVKNALKSYDGGYYDERRARQAVERALPPYFSLLLRPIWTERKAVSAYKAYAALLILATERGVKIDEGIRVGVDIRTLAETCNVSADTLGKNALPWLSKKRLVRWRRGKGERAGYFVLHSMRVAFDPVYTPAWITRVRLYAHTMQHSVELYAQLRQLIRLCYGRSKTRLFGRLGSLAAMVLLPLVIEGREMHLDDLASITGRESRHLNSVVNKLIEASLVVEAGKGVYRLPLDFWDRFDFELEESGITEVERLRKRRHDAHREGRELHKGKSPDKVPKRPKKEDGASQTKVKIAKRESRDAGSLVLEGGGADTITGAEEVFTLARRLFPNRDDLPPPPPTPGRDPMVHRDTEKEWFFMPCKVHRVRDCDRCRRDFGWLVHEGESQSWAMKEIYVVGGVGREGGADG